MTIENNMRGIVIAPSLDLDAHKNISYLGTIHPDTFKKYLLYFDKIDIPKTTRIGFESTPDDKFLESAGILEHTLHDEGSTFQPKHTKLNLIENALKIRHSVQPGQWSLANHKLSPSENQLTKNPGIEIKIYECLPIPSPESSFDDILNYKDKRKDELLEFRNHLDDIYQLILSQPDTERGLVTAIANLKKSITNVNASATKGLLRRVASSFNISLNIESTFSLASALLAGDKSQVIKEALGFISLEPAKLFTATEIPKDLKALSYLVNLNKI
ncbi:hypothetical protein HBO43_15730 [Pseudomonas veronii]|uniref:Uncharacterized protein n=1 Tax=Pseudomonas veronii TaxID=76761 RepID=A0A7Y0ZU20_PSEVE|nr:DUF6236 family protein [Pseudomonas veronii]NMX98050.1 hypothetical protein [Pseudomonas veronii]SEC06418.1 hypothetical protein SAMN04490199_3754 [Pseudomonas marginalis]